MDSDLPLCRLNDEDEFTIPFGEKTDKDLELVNVCAEELNREAGDVMDYQVIH
jgi:hypothetical protein